MAVLPLETDTVLLIDPDAMLATARAAQPFEPIPWRNRQMSQILYPIELIQLASRDRPQLLRTSRAGGACVSPVEDVFRCLVVEGSYHISCYNG